LHGSTLTIPLHYRSTSTAVPKNLSSMLQKIRIFNKGLVSEGLTTLP